MVLTLFGLHSKNALFVSLGISHMRSFKEQMGTFPGVSFELIKSYHEYFDTLLINFYYR